MQVCLRSRLAGVTTAVTSLEAVRCHSKIMDITSCWAMGVCRTSRDIIIATFRSCSSAQSMQLAFT